jgi:23S rRNA (cytidine1920-2'-O)/16S rRNA (cytidine1409-2'-O)-methyltransferase
VTAVDVGRGQLAWSLRQDPRVEVREGINARYLSSSDFGRRFDLIVGDLSFISLTKILPAAFELLKPEGSMIVLIKPQFEAGAANVGSKGVVRDPVVHQEVCERIVKWIGSLEIWRVDGIVESPITGPEGNKEFLLGARRS